MSDSNPKLQRFNECRNTFVTSLNSISILSSLVFLTIFVPYTTYVGNLLAKRVEIETVETKMPSGQKELIPIYPPELNYKEQNGNFELQTLEKEWLDDHDSSAYKTAMLAGSTNFNNPVGTFSFSKPEIVLIYPAVVSILLAYLSLHFYDLLSLKQKLKNEDEDEELVKIPGGRIAIASISLVFCLICSWLIILSSPKIPTNTNSESVILEFQLRRIKESFYQLTPDIDLWIFFPSPEKIESRLGKIIAKESSYQVTSDIDLLIFALSSLVLLSVLGVVTFKEHEMLKK